MKIALIGNQNSGKTTLFNLLTGMNATIGNWPGVTIEKKSGIIKGTDFEIVDLPGIYSLSPYSIEEEISRKFIFDDNPDLIINIIDSTSLERSLYLTTQLLELDTKVIIALNMVDILEKKGISIDVNKLESILNVDIIEISALKETGVNELVFKIKEYSVNNSIVYSNLKKYDVNIEKAIDGVKNKLGTELLHKNFISVKILEDDNRFKLFETNEMIKIKFEVSNKYDTDLEEIIATQRYDFIDSIKKSVLKTKIIRNNLTDELDKIFLNKWISFPIFVLIMFFIYFLSVGVIGSFTVDFVSSLIEKVSVFLETFLLNMHASSWIISLIVDGIIKGVGSVLSFVPQLCILFLCISILETTGYMSRIAFLLDKFFRKIGLNGKSLIPFIIGAGCSVPGIMGSRIIENQDERKMTAILTPFIPCSAKLPIITLFTGYFFGENSGMVSVSLYFFAVIVIILSAFIMKKFVFKSVSNTYISELPDYKLPNFKYIFKDVSEKVISFIKRAGSVILVASIVIWFLLSFSFDLNYGVDVEDSILAGIGNKISWIFYPMIGENSWGAAVSAIQGLVAKEQVVSSMAVIAGFTGDIEMNEVGNTIFDNNSGIFSFFTKSSAYAFLIFNLFSAPCFGTLAAMKRELGGIKKMIKAATFQCVIAWVLAVLVYQLGSRIEIGLITFADLIISTIIFIIVCIILFRKSKVGECDKCPYSKNCDKK